MRAAMGFTKPEEAKPKQPRDNGEPCAGGCGRKLSSQWRGPGSAWCNESCKDQAKAARAALRTQKMELRGEQLKAPEDDRVAKLEAKYADLLKAHNELNEWSEEIDNILEAAENKEKEQDATIAAMREELDAQRQQLTQLAQIAGAAAAHAGKRRKAAA